MLSVSAWLDQAASDVVTAVLKATREAPINVREAIPQPSQVDLAIIARVADLLSPAIAQTTVRQSA